MNLISLAVMITIAGSFYGNFINHLDIICLKKKRLNFKSAKCPKCENVFRPQIIPLVWLPKKLKCENCRSTIPSRYPLIELLCSGLYLSTLLKVTQASNAPLNILLVGGGIILSSIIILLSIIDIDYLILPDFLCKIGIICGFFVNTIYGYLLSVSELTLLGFKFIISALIAFLAMRSLSHLSRKIYKQTVLGIGDAKFAALGGAWLGLNGIAVSLLIAFLAAGMFSAIGLLSGRLKSRQPFAFGPFISLGIWGVWILEPDWWWDSWHSLLGI